MFDSVNGHDGCNLNFWGMCIQSQLSWCQFGWDLVDLLFLDFLHSASAALKVNFDFIAPHLLLVTISVEKLAMIPMDCFAFAFDILKAFVDTAVPIWCQGELLWFRTTAAVNKTDKFGLGDISHEFSNCLWKWNRFLAVRVRQVIQTLVFGSAIFDSPGSCHLETFHEAFNN